MWDRLHMGGMHTLLTRSMADAADTHAHTHARTGNGTLWCWLSEKKGFLTLT